MIRARTATTAALLAGIALAGCKPIDAAGDQPEPVPAIKGSEIDKPELYDVMHRGLYEPMPYEGGNQDTCGAWAAQDPADARQMAADCPPLTKGHLP